MNTTTRNKINNTMLRIAPYWSSGTWAFDDDAHGLVAEPFVCGAPAMIDHVLATARIPLAEARRRGIGLIFSATPFPGAHKVALRVRPDSGGTWYRFEEPALEGWLCPAMFHYFDTAPERLHIRAELAGEEAPEEDDADPDHWSVHADAHRAAEPHLYDTPERAAIMRDLWRTWTGDPEERRAADERLRRLLLLGDDSPYRERSAEDEDGRDGRSPRGPGTREEE